MIDTFLKNKKPGFIAIAFKDVSKICEKYISYIQGASRGELHTEMNWDWIMNIILHTEFILITNDFKRRKTIWNSNSVH